MYYTIDELKSNSARFIRIEPTGEYRTARNGKRVPVTVGREYVSTVGAGSMSRSRWYEEMLIAVKMEGKEKLLEMIKDHCRTNCAWLKNDAVITNYALEALSSGVYESWGIRE